MPMFCCGAEEETTDKQRSAQSPQRRSAGPNSQTRAKVVMPPSPTLAPTTATSSTTTTNTAATKGPVHKPEHQQHAKTDVTVYEGTDSTVETEHNGSNYRPTVTTTTSNNVTTKTSVLNGDEDSSGQQLYTSNSETEDDVAMADYEDDNRDDFFDLAKLQPGQTHAASGSLLDPAPQHLKNRKCLILDLDETLVHSSFKYMRQADFVIPVDIDNQIHNVYVIKRPGVDEFMRRVGELYEVVVFTASVSRYGDPLLDALDIHNAVHHRLFRDSCYNYQGNYIKNLSQIGRPLSDLIILDNSPASYIFHPQHAIPISSWFSDAHDNELLDIIPFLEDLSKQNVEDVGIVLDINV